MRILISRRRPMELTPRDITTLRSALSDARDHQSRIVDQLIHSRETNSFDSAIRERRELVRAYRRLDEKFEDLAAIRRHDGRPAAHRISMNASEAGLSDTLASE